MRSYLKGQDICRDRITRELLNNIGSESSFIKEIGEHILTGDGKLLRPLLFILSCKLLGYEHEHIYSLSTVFEYIHVASLLHDDVIDNADTRRNKPSVNNKWGNHVAILEGDFLYCRALTVALSTENMRFLKVLARATNEMVEGQLMEIGYSNNLALTKEQYMNIIKKKTASLLSASCECAAIVAEAGTEKEKALKEFGHNLGIAFQLIDDMLDYISSEEVFGKPVGKDLKEGKVTLPLIYALQEMREDEIKRIDQFLRGKKDSKKEHEYVLKRVIQTNAISKTKQDAFSFINKAKESLAIFNSSPEKEALIEISNYIIHRNY